MTGMSQFGASLSKIRNRDHVIWQLLPKIFGIIRDRGRPNAGHLGLAAPVNDELTLAAYAIDPLSCTGRDKLWKVRM